MIEEEAVVDTLSSVLLSDDEIDGLDEDLVLYISGMIATKVSEEPDSDFEEALEEVMIPFLESVQCPEELIAQAKQDVLQLIQKTQEVKSSGTGGGGASSSKLRQGVVSMSSDLHSTDDAENDATRYLWGTDQGVKPAANALIDAYSDKTSAKDKRKAQKKELAQQRKALSKNEQLDEFNKSNKGLVTMAFNINDLQQQSKKKDVQVRNVNVSLDNGTSLLDQGELKFAYQRRYGLIGENGVGKTTLLKHIAKGDIEGFPKHLRVLHVRQEIPDLDKDKEQISVIQAVIESDAERNALLQQEKELLAKLETKEPQQPNSNDNDTTNMEQETVEAKRKRLLEANQKENDSSSSSSSSFEKDLKKLDDLYQRLQSLSSDSAQARAAMILSGLQFTPEMQTGPISSLSGGWQMRVALAAALFVEPDICLLDEPTNHLDLEAVLWLESYLADYKHTLIVVSHDRGFLNEVCTDIIEFKKKKLTYYRGNFDTYVKLRDENIRNAMRVYQAYKTKRDHMMEFIEKFRANAKRATMVQSRIKTVEKMDAEAPPPVEIEQVWRFSIPTSEPVSRPIISVDDVFFDYKAAASSTKIDTSEYLLQKVNFGVDLTSRIAILGANGQGKTTLLNLIMGRIQAMKGSVSINQNLRIGHFTQHSGDNFDLSLSAVENMMSIFESENPEDLTIRSFLGKFQIQGNDALKPMRLLSGGQKSRVAFATLAYKRPHVLVIDEGSNHLSMEAVDALIEAIRDFKGGILVVSHDQYFVSNTCTELWVIEQGKATRFRGDFNEYKKFTAETTQKRVEESVKRMNAINK